MNNLELLYLAGDVMKHYRGIPDVVNEPLWLGYLDEDEVSLIIRTPEFSHEEALLLSKFIAREVLKVESYDTSFQQYIRPEEVYWGLVHTQDEIYGDAEVVYQLRVSDNQY